MFDVGDAFELTFTTTPGATVVVAWIDPDGTVVFDNQAVAEATANPGDFPYTFLPTRDGVWEARFTASGAATAVERYWVRAEPVTGPPPLATIGEVGELFGTLIPAQEVLTKGLLRRASAMVRSRWPDLQARIAAGTIDPQAPIMAVINMVLRVLRNPGGLKAETTGPFSRTYDTSTAAGLLVISETETELMAPPAESGQASPVGTIIAQPSLLGYTPWSGDACR